jgi:hypothetical protein
MSGSQQLFGRNNLVAPRRVSIPSDMSALQITGGRRRIENVLVLEPHTVKSQEREYLESIAVVVGNTEQLGIGIEGDHRFFRGKPKGGR